MADNKNFQRTSGGSFSTHRPVDNSDPGFSMPGKRLRWLSGAVEDRRAGRIWESVKFSQLPEGLQKYIQEKFPRNIQNDNVRRGDLILSWASVEACEEERAKLKENLAITNAALNKTRAAKQKGDIETSTELEKRFG